MLAAILMPFVAITVVVSSYFIMFFLCSALPCALWGSVFLPLVAAAALAGTMFLRHVFNGNQAMSTLFGYYLRKADVRYQLDKIVLLGRGEVW